MHFINFAQIFYCKSAGNFSQSRSDFIVMNYFDIAIFIGSLHIYRDNGCKPLVHHYKVMGKTLHILESVDSFSLFECFFLQLFANSATSYWWLKRHKPTLSSPNDMKKSIKRTHYV